MNYTFVQNVKILCAEGAVNSLGEIIKELGYHKALLVHGGSIRRSGTYDKLAASMDAAGISYVSFEKVKSDPPAEIVDEGGKFARECGCDCVVAIGGGSAIDMGKAINLLRFNEGSCLEYFEKPQLPSPGMIAIPTTSGTGSELSTGSVISAFGKKLPLPVYNSMPEVAILDPELTVSVPERMTLLTGLDAFSHAVEGYCNVMSNPMMDAICEKIMSMIVENLPKAVADGSNLNARKKMQISACMAGWCLTNVYANVGHSLAHTVGAVFHVVHGAACAYGLPPVLKHIAPAVSEKVKYIGTLLGAEFTGSETPVEIGEKTAAAYRAFIAAMNFGSVKDENIVVDDLDALAEAVVTEPFAQLTPVPVDHDAAVKLLKEMLEIA